MKILARILLTVVLGTTYGNISWASDSEYQLGIRGLNGAQGVTITQSDPQGPCSRLKSLRGDIGSAEAGDIVKAVNGKPVFTTEDVRRIVNSSQNGEVVLSIYDIRTQVVRTWKTTATKDPNYVIDPDVKSASDAICNHLANQGLDNHFVPNHTFDTKQFNPVIFEIIWRAHQDKICRIMEGCLRVQNVYVSYSLSVTNKGQAPKYKIVFSCNNDNRVRDVLKKVFALPDDQFVDFKFSSVQEAFRTSQFYDIYKDGNTLNLEKVSDGMKACFKKEQSVIARLRLSMDYGAITDGVYTKSEWRKAIIGDINDATASGYYWQVHAAVKKNSEKNDSWIVGATIVVGRLPLGEFNVNRIRVINISDNIPELASALMTSTLLNGSSINVRQITRAQPMQPGIQLANPIKVDSESGTIFNTARTVFEEMKTQFINPNAAE